MTQPAHMGELNIYVENNREQADILLKLLVQYMLSSVKVCQIVLMYKKICIVSDKVIPLNIKLCLDEGIKKKT